MAFWNRGRNRAVVAKLGDDDKWRWRMVEQSLFMRRMETGDTMDVEPKPATTFNDTIRDSYDWASECFEDAVLELRELIAPSRLGWFIESRGDGKYVKCLYSRGSGSVLIKSKRPRPRAAA